MTTFEEIPADQLLAKLFEVVLNEARSNRQFAQKLIGALPTQVVVRIESGPKKGGKPVEPPISLTSLMNREGEAALRAFLKPKKKAQLHAMIERQQLPIDPAILDSAPQAIRDAIVDGVKWKIADRLAAAS